MLVDHIFKLSPSVTLKDPQEEMNPYSIPCPADQDKVWSSGFFFSLYLRESED